MAEHSMCQPGRPWQPDDTLAGRPPPAHTCPALTTHATRALREQE